MVQRPRGIQHWRRWGGPFDPCQRVVSATMGWIRQRSGDDALERPFESGFYSGSSRFAIVPGPNWL